MKNVNTLAIRVSTAIADFSFFPRKYYAPLPIYKEMLSGTVLKDRR
jgi:hypothetical protein